MNEYSYILVVVDMQACDQSRAGYDQGTLQATEREIERAKSDGVPIFFLESAYFGLDCSVPPTQKRLLDLVEDYPLSRRVTKNMNDGSIHVNMWCECFEFWHTNTWRVCGINTDMCVIDTVRGLLRRGGEGTTVEVVQDACNSCYNKDCWEKFDKPGIVLIAA